ncbi:MAG: NUDIX domain-containing protein [Clostridia bacterium]|nr:NUDIX domain-containing protein [Clostridia bacterium]
MDITFKIEQGKFNYRVCGIITHNNKILALKDEGGPYYYLPGGRVKLHENVEEAIKREIKEELKVDAELIRPLWFHQNFFNEEITKEKFHEICIYFLLDVSKTGLLEKGETFSLNDGEKQLNFKWIEFEKLKEEHLYPTFIKKEILNLPENLTILTDYDYKE